jgi:hypothetical protein
MLIWTSLEEADVLAGVEDGAADVVAAEREVDDGEGDGALWLWDRFLQIPHGMEQSLEI